MEYSTFETLVSLLCLGVFPCVVIAGAIVLHRRRFAHGYWLYYVLATLAVSGVMVLTTGFWMDIAPERPPTEDDLLGGIGLAVGVWGGALLTALAGCVAGFVGSFRAETRERREDPSFTRVRSTFFYDDVK